MASWTGGSSTGGGGWSWGGWGDDPDEDEEADYESSRGYYSSKDCLILLVDCSQPMFRAPAGEDSDTPFAHCMKCAKSVLLNKIVSNDKDLVGIVFFGTEKHKNSSDFKHVYVLQEMDTPDATRIKEIEDMLEDDDFDRTYGHSSDFSLSDVFWTCSTMLAASGTKYSHKRILLFTNVDNPHESRPALQRQAKQKAKDLAENGVDVELMHMGASFDTSVFYQDIIFTGDEDLAALPNPAERFEELLTRVRSKEYKKRAVQRIPFSLGPDIEIGIGVYTMVRETKKPSFVRLDKRTNEELKTQTKMLCDDTGTELMPTDMKYYQMFGGEKVIFEKEEVAEMKKFDDPGLKLMGFKPMSRFKKHFYTKPANFIYPDESVINGSSRLFTALLKRCLSREVFAMCRYIPRANSPPSFIALVPQEEVLDENNVQISPPGFHAIFLPFAEDVRKLQIAEDMPKATNEQVDKAKEIIKKLTFHFQSEAFENPVLQKHYRTLEAIALSHESVEEVVDLTEPDQANINKRVGNLLNQLKELVYPDGYEPGKKVTKRKVGAGGGGAAKRPKADSGAVNVEEEAKNGTLGRLTVAVLKDYLKSVGKKTAGKKQDLIDSVKEYLAL